MAASPHLERADGYAVMRLSGSLQLSEVVDLVTGAISFARSEELPRLMVVMTDVTGFKSPGLATRYEFIREWARVSGGLVRLVMVTRPEMIDPDKFGVTVAANAGMVTNIFEDEASALAWLMSDE